jgi:hypothetical protein
MTTRVGRPSFFEGQVLRAADLDLGQEYGRGTMARHDRYLHTAGIATGLELTLDSSTGVNEVKLSPGLAIDATGRQIVVDREESLAAEDLVAQGVLIPADTDPAVEQDDRPWHPVFLVGRDESSSPPSFVSGCSAGGQPTRTDEAYDVTYGRPGDEKEPAPAMAVTDGPESVEAVPVLIGFVQWDGNNGFAKAMAVPRTGLSAAYAGARADEVVARSGTLALRADTAGVRDKMPAVVLDGEKGGMLHFGLQDDTGKLNTVFSVDAGGNVELSGVLKSPYANDMWVESGMLFDGMTIPLPSGVTQDKVDSGEISLSIVVTPRLRGETQPPGAVAGTSYIRTPFECKVDGRRVFVRDRWIKIVPAPVAEEGIYPGACDYIVLASATGRTP